jgi:hypothetical protein
MEDQEVKQQEETTNNETSEKLDSEKLGMLFSAIGKSISSLPHYGRCDISVNVHVGEKVVTSNYYRDVPGVMGIGSV